MYHKFMSGLSYQCTNESLNAIMLSLKPKETDRVLAVGGSGDQAFAMLEMGAEVLCVDIDPKQIHYIRQRIGLLKEENCDSFLKATEELLYNAIKRRNDYFRKFNRLNKIKENLNNLEVLCTDIQEIVKGKEQFTKAYLSNITSYFHGDTFKTHAEFKEFMKQLADRLPLGGLTYIANHDKTCRTYGFTSATAIINERLEYPIPNPKGFLPDELEIDEERSTIARIHEQNQWSPTIYKRAR